MNKYSLKFLLIATLWYSIPLFAQHSVSAQKPNILMILVDDFGWRDIHRYGSDFYETPHMDKLIDEGMQFTQAYSTYPRCVPSRYSIMTGSHPARKKGDGEGGERDGESGFSITSPNISIGQVIKSSGYRTFYVGKWHLGAEEYAPLGKGFDQSIAAGAAGAPTSHFAPYNIGRNGKSSKEAPIPNVENAAEGENLEDRLTDETIKLINESGGKPFFGILAHYAVHTPLQGKQEYINYFKDKLSKMPSYQGESYENESAGQNKLYQDNATYAAMIKSVDEGVGRILAELKKKGLDKNTIVIVTSDHGGLSARGNTRELATSNRPLRAGKGHLYEGGIRVPLFIKWPGVVKEGSVSEMPVQGIDHFPTLVQIAGGVIPEGQQLDGMSYLPSLKEKEGNVSRALYWHNMAPRPTSTGDVYSSVIRKGNYKLVDLYAENRRELYDLSKDVGERNDISGKYPDVVTSLYKDLDTWRKQIGADMKIKSNSLSEREMELRGTKERNNKKKEEKREARKDARKQTSLYKTYEHIFPIGTAVNPEIDLGSEARKQLILQQFNSITAENHMKPKMLQPVEGQFDWKKADKIVDFAKANNILVRGHTLVWYQSTPTWMVQDAKNAVTKAILLKRLKVHINTVLDHFKGRVYCWDVVNEAISDNKDEIFRAKDLLYQIAGEDYVAEAFRYAHAADPTIKLFYNDYRFSDPIKRQKIYNLLKSLKDKSVPIHGVGLQAHLTPWEMTPEYLQETIDMFASLGLEVQLTELDISIYKHREKDFASTPVLTYNEDIADKQAKYYEAIFDILRRNKDKVTGVTLWGLTDLQTNFRSNRIGRPDYPFLFTEDLKPKKAVFRIQEFVDNRKL